MNIYFSNKTTVRSENNMSDLDIMQANNELGREKKKLRYTVTIAIAIPVFIIIYFFLIPRLFHNVGMRIVIAAISMVIGYFPAEAVVRAKYGSGAGTGAVVTPPKTFTYNFTEDKIMIVQDFETMNIPYNAIEKVTQNPYNYYIYYMGYKYQLDKNGFTTNTGEFERLMINIGKNIGIEYGN
ncbi:MAG: YcxB family protein [Ruminococcus sp.]|nr:YcxB family protein [Ruminococcus sp.]